MSSTDQINNRPTQSDPLNSSGPSVQTVAQDNNEANYTNLVNELPKMLENGL